MAISDTNKAKINKMNKASQNVNLGTIVQDLQSGCAVSRALVGASGSRTASGSELDINTGLASVSSWIVQIRHPVSVGGVVAVATAGSVAGHIKVISASSLSGSMAANDIVTFFAFA